jgi:hypothetical protein
MTGMWDVGHVVLYKLTDFSEALTASMFRAMMEASNTYEMSIKLYEITRHNISKDIHPHIRRHKNLKPHVTTFG